MVLVLFGDTRELHREVEVPAGDILICVGDSKSRMDRFSVATSIANSG